MGRGTCPGAPGYTRAVPTRLPSSRTLAAILAVVVLYIAIAAAPARMAVARVPAPATADVCSALHGGAPESPSHRDHVPWHPHCGGCPLCSAPAAAPPPGVLPAVATAPGPLRPAAQPSLLRAGRAVVVARARGPPQTS